MVVCIDKQDKEVLRNVKDMLIAVQHKICDVAQLLVDLYVRVSSLEERENMEVTKDSIKSALRQ